MHSALNRDRATDTKVRILQSLPCIYWELAERSIAGDFGSPPGNRREGSNPSLPAIYARRTLERQGDSQGEATKGRLQQLRSLPCWHGGPRKGMATEQGRGVSRVTNILVSRDLQELPQDEEGVVDSQADWQRGRLHLTVDQIRKKRGGSNPSSVTKSSSLTFVGLAERLGAGLQIPSMLVQIQYPTPDFGRVTHGAVSIVSKTIGAERHGTRYLTLPPCDRGVTGKRAGFRNLSERVEVRVLPVAPFFMSLWWNW